jgi:hypothetical protein
MVTAILTSSTSPDGEQRLGAFGLSTELIHTALRPGLSRASSRTSMALRSTPGTDVYHESMEQLHLLLAEAGWRLVYVDRQPRLLHPDGLMAFTIASGVNVANPDHRLKPRTRRKGKATRDSLAGPRAEVATLFDGPDVEQEKALVAACEAAPLWLLVHERTERGLHLELSRPAEMTASGVVTDWDHRVMIGFLDLDGDLSIFDSTDIGGFDVPVEPR